MQAYQFTLKPLTAFATAIYGDTLFGQLCWAIRNRYGEDKLTELLDGYTENQPFAIVSNAFPEGYIPLPKIPGYYYKEVAGLDRKSVKKLAWLPLDALSKSLSEWLQYAKSETEIAQSYGEKKISRLQETHPQPHNSINRQTGTTGDGFAPYSIEQHWFHPQLQWHCYIQIDEQRTDIESIQQCLEDIGLIGYGRDASIGMGKFALKECQVFQFNAQNKANACLTLAPCAAQGQGYNVEKSYYQIFTRFGRHGDRAVQQGKPFKNPVLLAQAGAVFSIADNKKNWIGQGIGGQGELSKIIPGTVQQGYSPVVDIYLSNDAECHCH